MAITVRFVALTGNSVATVKTETFETGAAAFEAVAKYANENGFTNVKEIDGEDPGSLRYTAKTPGGRPGRNVAFGDYEGSDVDVDL